MLSELYILPNEIADRTMNVFLTPMIRERIGAVQWWFSESEKALDRFLRRCGVEWKKDAGLTILGEKPEYLQMAGVFRNSGAQIFGLISDAGYPCIADPGAEVVQAAHAAGCKVIPFPGPGSIFMALAASGAQANRFTFHGYLPVKENELSASLRKITEELRNGYTQVFIETPYRSARMIEQILKKIPGDFRLCVAADLMSPEEKIISMSVQDWKKKSGDPIGKSPAVFILFKSG